MKNSNYRSRTPEYIAWSAMWRRCIDLTAYRYDRYGGRGISVCERWKSFDLFSEDMGKKPTPLHSLDRIDNDGNYEPGNCRWATKKEQARNRVSSHVLVLDGISLSIVEWAGGTGIPASVISMRLLRLNWTVTDALQTPVLSSSECSRRAIAKRYKRD